MPLVNLEERSCYASVLWFLIEKLSICSADCMLLGYFHKSVRFWKCVTFVGSQKEEKQEAHTVILEVDVQLYFG